MKTKYCITFENGESIKKLINNGYWIKTIIYIN